MAFKFEIPEDVTVTVIDYLKRVIMDSLEALTGSAATPAGDKLFKVRPDEDNELLDETRTQALHHAVAQLLFASSRASKDIHATLTFLITPVRLSY
jgi:hypothetical protein